MPLAEYIESNKQRLIDHWKQLVEQRLDLGLDGSDLVDELPQFLSELAAMARDPEGYWLNLEFARSHGRHRNFFGVDIGSMAVELGLIGEALVQLMREDGQVLDHQEMELLTRVIGESTAASVTSYAALRDRQLADQAAQHFSFIAHEIRNPLHNAKMAAELTNSGPADMRLRNAARLQRALTELAELIDNSLVQARMYGTPNMQVESQNVIELLAVVRENVTAHAELRGQTITIEVEPFEFEADRKLLLSALTNLARNAVKFTPEQGAITLRARETEGRALFEVEDECGGMPKDLPERLFQPFVQGGADRSGFGLGLVIVKQAVDAHRGSVRVDNRPGCGCTVVLDLPLRQTA